jgi:hypothetical protein
MRNTLNVTVISTAHPNILSCSLMPKVNISLYGDIAIHGGGTHISNLNMDLPEGAVVDSLLKALGLDPEDRGYLFINAVLHDAPGLYASKDAILREDDHIGIFSVRHMWPYQYRDGIHMSDALKTAMGKHGGMRNTYRGESDP